VSLCRLRQPPQHRCAVTKDLAGGWCALPVHVRCGLSQTKMVSNAGSVWVAGLLFVVCHASLLCARMCAYMRASAATSTSMSDYEGLLGILLCWVSASCCGWLCALCQPPQHRCVSDMLTWRVKECSRPCALLSSTLSMHLHRWRVCALRPPPQHRCAELATVELPKLLTDGKVVDNAQICQVWSGFAVCCTGSVFACPTNIFVGKLVCQ
jgi:hypothetical protein